MPEGSELPPDVAETIMEMETMNLALYKHLKAHGCECKSVFDDPPKEEKK